MLLKCSSRERETLCKDRPPSEECGALIFGSLVHNLPPPELLTEYRVVSVLELRGLISGFQIRFLPKFRCWTKSCLKTPASYSALASACRCGGYFIAKGSHSETCDPMPTLLACIDGIISSVRGMDLEASKRIPMKGPNWEGLDLRWDFFRFFTLISWCGQGQGVHYRAYSLIWGLQGTG